MNVGDEFIFYRDSEKDDFWHMGINILVKTDADPDTVGAVLKCRIVPRRGMLFRVISIQGFRAVPL